MQRMNFEAAGEPKLGVNLDRYGREGFFFDPNPTANLAGRNKDTGGKDAQPDGGSTHKNAN
jgi:hypothetical protein